MNDNLKDKRIPYRWLVLGISWLSYFFITMAWYLMPTLEYQLLNIYNINSAQYSTALTLPFLIAGILAIIGGILADLIGIKRTASMGIIIAGIGIFLRFNTGEFILLLFPMIILGIGVGLIMPNFPKLVSIWFPSEETGLATGIYNTGLMGGISTGLVVAPFLPGWSSGNIIMGIIIILLGIVFFIFVKDAPSHEVISSSSLLEGVNTAVRSKSTRLATLAIFMAMAGMVAFQGALPGGLHKIYGIPMATAGQIASLISYLGIPGSLTLPLIANKLNKRRLFLILLPISFSILMFLTWILGNNTIILWIGTGVAGYLAGGALPLIMEVPTFLPRIENDPVNIQHLGGVSGILTSMMNIGGFLGLPFIVMPIIVNYGYTKGFLMAAILFSLQSLFAMGIQFPD